MLGDVPLGSFITLFFSLAVTLPVVLLYSKRLLYAESLKSQKDILKHFGLEGEKYCILQQKEPEGRKMEIYEEKSGRIYMINI